MTDSLRNYQKFIKSVVLYEVNNWTTIDKICENLRKLVGNRLIPKSSSFPDLSVESLTKLVKDMDVKDITNIKKEQKFIRSVILYEFLIGEKDKDKIYKKLCRNIGLEAIDYSEFSHWFYPFNNGYHDFDDDSLHSKPPTFSDLPLDLVGIIVEKLDLKEQLSLRKLSRNLRIVVDRQKPAYGTIEFNFEHNVVLVEFNDENVMYCDTEFDVVVQCSLSFLDFVRPKIIKSSDYIDTAYNDLAVALKNPKLQLESLKFKYYTDAYSTGYENAARFYEKMGNLMKTLNHKTFSKSFLMKTEHENHMLAILSYLKPGVLKTIRRTKNNFGTSTDFSIDQIVTLDQWKRAKSVSIDGLISTPIEQFFHLNRFEVKLNSVSIRDLILIRDELLISNEFQYCYLKSDEMPSFNEINRVFNFRGHINANSSFLCYYRIPKSQHIFGFSITNLSLFIERNSPHESYYLQSFDE